MNRTLPSCGLCWMSFRVAVMADWLLHLLSLSAGGALAILLLLVIERLAGLRYAAKWRCLAWLLLCLRLGITLSLSMNPIVPTAPIRVEVPADAVIYQPVAPQTERTLTTTQPSQNTPVQPQERDTADSMPQSRPVKLSEALFVLWALGAAGVLGWAIIGHIRFSRYLRRWGTPIAERRVWDVLNDWKAALGLRTAPWLLTCPGLDTPMLAGIFRPRLLLPSEPMDNTRLRHALLHELTHYKRHDIAFKTMVLWVCALHWFNPAVWLMRRAVERDLELACDDAALRVLPESERAAYGNTVLQAVTGKKGVVSDA